MNEIQELREEVTKLRERVAVLEARPGVQAPTIDWTRPIQVGTPRFVSPFGPFPPGTITCSAGERQ